MVLAEAASLTVFSIVYNLSQQKLPPTPYGSIASGALSGAALAMVSTPLDSRAYPESWAEFRASPYRPFNAVAKSAIGWAMFSAVYQGLRVGVFRARIGKGEAADVVNGKQALKEPIFYVTNFLAGGLGGLAHRAAALPFFRGPVDNPLLSKQLGPRLFASTFVGMGVFGCVLAVTDVYAATFTKARDGPAVDDAADFREAIGK
ncbi:hypothetical protein HDV00_004731 [Rhizophlyctis rosea]|nr:hypothetical protein HDV00_004731 [Rhizophlyctis rosea]